MNIKKAVFLFTFALSLSFSSPLVSSAGEHHDHGGGHHEHGGEHEDEGKVVLSNEQKDLIGLKLYKAEQKEMPQTISAPGTIQYSTYRMTDISTPMDIIVIKRHISLGEEVEKGQELVTVSSVVLGEAQASYLRALAEYKLARSESRRLKGLSKQKIVSAKRLQKVEAQFSTARANLRQAKAHLEAFGLRKSDIEALKEEEKRLPFGQIILRSKERGTVVFDDFRVGQAIPAGQKLLQVVDETEVWVEAKLGEKDFAAVRAEQPARVFSRAYPDRVFNAKVLLLHHALDPVTRTAGVRLSVRNEEDLLKPGMFVNVEIIAGKGKKALLIPEEAVQRQGDEHIVFVEEEPGHYERREVITAEKSAGWINVTEGLNEGEYVVTKGAFTLLAELEKSGFAEHNH